VNYYEKLAARTRQVGAPVCIGLDPAFEKHRVEDVAAFNRAIIEATAPYAACYKPNIAFYEQWGIPGLRALEETLAAIPEDIPVIGDVKRGDMGNTAQAYARAMFDQWDFDAITLNGYLGLESVEPYLAYPDRGFYLLCRTSNPGATDLQYAMVHDAPAPLFEESARRAAGATPPGGIEIGDRPLFEHMALVQTGWSARIGLVVGATAPAELRRVRELVPNASILVPGVGAQGGSAVDAIDAAWTGPGSLVVSASRSILYASEGADFAEAAARAARDLRDEMAAAASAPA
jgi:orotidine-5'-phosphate decarboxylase